MQGVHFYYVSLLYNYIYHVIGMRCDVHRSPPNIIVGVGNTLGTE